MLNSGLPRELICKIVVWRGSLFAKSEFDVLIDYATKSRLGELAAGYTWSRLGSVCSFVPPGKSEKLVWVV